ncbi:hypothetical protein VLK81_02700 [Citroniella saccharovorans]|uniref:Uncharacterized protein n=1 Tax=Citroniella saccharovorans TaxID=2053367 RepID=A0AAW9MST7_9FIRM|nr:hypothetical protein [Citroniella saccharovorans]MEB3428943.1 hypothetical protein [Citroniella saccharovorans]
MNNFINGIKDSFKLNNIFKVLQISVAIFLFVYPISSFLYNQKIGIEWGENPNLQRFSIVKNLKLEHLDHADENTSSLDILNNKIDEYDSFLSTGGFVSFSNNNGIFYIFGDRDLLSDYFNVDEDININVLNKDIKDYSFKGKSYKTSLIKKNFVTGYIMDPEMDDIFIVLPDINAAKAIDTQDFPKSDLGIKGNIFEEILKNTMIDIDEDEKIEEFKNYIREDTDYSIKEIKHEEKNGLDFYLKSILVLVLVLSATSFIGLSYNFEGKIFLYAREASIKNIEGFSIKGIMNRFMGYIVGLLLISLFISYILFLRFMDYNLPLIILLTFIFLTLIFIGLTLIVYFMLRRENLSENLRLDYKEGI